MKIYRSNIAKMLDQDERDIIITDPKQPVRTFFRKIYFILSMWNYKLREMFRAK